MPIVYLFRTKIEKPIDWIRGKKTALLKQTSRTAYCERCPNKEAHSCWLLFLYIWIIFITFSLLFQICDFQIERITPSNTLKFHSNETVIKHHFSVSHWNCIPNVREYLMHSVNSKFNFYFFSLFAATHFLLTPIFSIKSNYPAVCYGNNWIITYNSIVPDDALKSRMVLFL